MRSRGVPVTYGRVEDSPRVLDDWLAAHPEGVACVIRAVGSPGIEPASSGHVRTRTPAEAKGLEFDLVVVDPGSFGSGDTDSGITGAVDRYVAKTRATRQLIELRP